MREDTALCSTTPRRTGMPVRTRADVVYQAATVAAAILLLMSAAIS